MSTIFKVYKILLPSGRYFFTKSDSELVLLIQEMCVKHLTFKTVLEVLITNDKDYVKLLQENI